MSLSSCFISDSILSFLALLGAVSVTTERPWKKKKNPRLHYILLRHRCQDNVLECLWQLQHILSRFVSWFRPIWYELSTMRDKSKEKWLFVGLIHRSSCSEGIQTGQNEHDTTHTIENNSSDGYTCCTNLVFVMDLLPVGFESCQDFTPLLLWQLLHRSLSEVVPYVLVVLVLSSRYFLLPALQVGWCFAKILQNTSVHIHQ